MVENKNLCKIKVVLLPIYFTCLLQERYIVVRFLLNKLILKIGKTHNLGLHILCQRGQQGKLSNSVSFYIEHCIRNSQLKEILLPRHHFAGSSDISFCHTVWRQLLSSVGWWLGMTLNIQLLEKELYNHDVYGAELNTKTMDQTKSCYFLQHNCLSGLSFY